MSNLDRFCLRSLIEARSRFPDKYFYPRLLFEFKGTGHGSSGVRATGLQGYGPRSWGGGGIGAPENLTKMSRKCHENLPKNHENVTKTSRPITKMSGKPHDKSRKCHENVTKTSREITKMSRKITKMSRKLFVRGRSRRGKD